MLYEGHVSREELARLLLDRLHRLPRYRQKVVLPPFTLAHPTWEDDPDFDIDHHIDEVTLPAPARRPHDGRGRGWRLRRDARSPPPALEADSGAGPTRRPYRDRLEDPPRDDRRHVRGRLDHGASRPDPRRRASHPTRGAVATSSTARSAHPAPGRRARPLDRGRPELHRLGVRPAPPGRDGRARPAAHGGRHDGAPLPAPAGAEHAVQCPALHRAPLRLARPALRRHPRDPVRARRHRERRRPRHPERCARALPPRARPSHRRGRAARDVPGEHAAGRTSAAPSATSCRS